MSRGDRVQLRVPTAQDASAWTALFDDPEVMRYVGTGEVRDHAYYADLVARQQRLAESTGLCLFSLLTDGRTVGFVGVHPWERPWGPHGMPEIGWRLGRAYWGRGYATEGARAVLGLARERGLPRLVSMIHAGNAASAAVATRLGMTLERELVSPDGARVHQFGLSLAG